MPDLSNPSSELGKPWLVTGGAGFIGGHVIQVLTEAKVPLILLDIDANTADQKFSDQVSFSILQEESVWFDVGSFEGLFSATDFVRTKSMDEGFSFGNPLEVGKLYKWI